MSLPSSSDSGMRAEIDWLRAVGPLVRGPHPYSLLREVVNNGPFVQPSENLRSRDRNWRRTLRLLSSNGLVIEKNGLVRATRQGQRVVAAISSAVTASSGAVQLAGRRLVLVMPPDDLAVRELVRGSVSTDTILLRTEGSYELAVVVPDDYKLATDLVDKVRSKKGHATQLRLVDIATADMT